MADEISPGEILSYTRQAREMGARFVKLTGGEPLLRADLDEIYRGLIQQGFGVSVETNGTVFDDSIVELMKEAPPRQVSVSLDSADREVHDDFRGVPGCWERTIAFIRHIVSANVATQVIMSTNSHSLGAVDDMARLLDGVGAKSLKINFITPLGRGGKLVSAHRSDIAERIEFTRAVYDRYGSGISINIPPAFVPLKRLPLRGRCNIRNLIGILPDGHVSFCGIGLSLPDLVFGNLRESSLREIWSTAPQLAEIRAVIPDRLKGICSRCIHRLTCLGGCVMENYALSGDLAAPHVFCQRAEEAGLFPPTRKL